MRFYVLCFFIFLFRAFACCASAQPPCLAAGSFFSAAAGPDGSLWVWGCNDYGQLGNDSVKPVAAPVPVEGIGPVKTVACGDAHTLAFMRDGTIKAWGRNNFGQLGTGGFSDTNRPVLLEGLSNVVDIAAGVYHSAVALEDGSVMCWGFNNKRQVSAVATEHIDRPLKIQLVTNAVSVACGAAHTMALTRDGRVWAWGDNTHGQMGYETVPETVVPILVPGLSNIVQIAAGDFHSLALDSKGRVFAWGLNGDGQLGVNSDAEHSVFPVEIDGMPDVLNVRAGSFISLAIGVDGSLWVWGENRDGQLGVAVEVPAIKMPVKVESVADVAIVAAGYKHVVMLQADGVMRACGSNDHGQLGDGSFMPGIIPVECHFNEKWGQRFEWAHEPYTITNAVTGVFYDFRAEAISSWGRDVEYRFDAGDSSPLVWQNSNVFSNMWNEPGTNFLFVSARSVSEPFYSSLNRNPFVVFIEQAHEIATPERPTGPSNVWTGAENRFTSLVPQSCSKGHALEFQYDWGDGGLSVWLPEPECVYAWAEEGGYEVKIRARCIRNVDLTSDWSKPFHISVVRPESTAPVYRLHSIGAAESTYGRIWTIDEAEKSYLDSLKSWRFESVAWHAYGKKVPGSVPMRRFLSKQTGIHHYSCDILEGAVLADNPVWLDEGVQFYVFPEQRRGAVPVYRFYNGDLGVHYLTVDIDEKQSFMDVPERGYVYEGILCYVPRPGGIHVDECVATENAEGVENNTVNERRGLWTRDIGWPGCVAVPGNYNVSGLADLAVYDADSGTWLVSGDKGETEWGGFAEGMPVQGDFDGDGIADMAVYEFNTGMWHIQGSATGYAQVEFGWPDAVPMARDFNGDGMADLGLYGADEGMWYIWSSSGAYYELQFGNSHSVPVPGDYDGSGMTDLAVYDSLSARWHIWTWKNGKIELDFGTPDAEPVPADYSGDGATDLGLFLPESGRWNILTMSGEYYDLQFGWPGAVPVPADYDGDGRTDIAVYDAGENLWYVWTW